MINQASIVRYRASVSEIFFPDFWNGTFSAESQSSFVKSGNGVRSHAFVSSQSLQINANRFLIGQCREIRDSRHAFPQRMSRIGAGFGN